MNRALILTALLLALPGPASAAAAPAKRAASHASSHFAHPHTTTTPVAADRRLGDVRIEGELTVPQVTFITAREPRRFFDFHASDYLPSRRKLGERTLYPSWIVTVPSPPETTRKESPR